MRKNIKPLLKQILKTKIQLIYYYDDGSSDNTLNIINSLKKIKK